MSTQSFSPVISEPVDNTNLAPVKSLVFEPRDFTWLERSALAAEQRRNFIRCCPDGCSEVNLTSTSRTALDAATGKPGRFGQASL
jgi:hypothetical protein